MAALRANPRFQVKGGTGKKKVMRRTSAGFSIQSSDRNGGRKKGKVICRTTLRRRGAIAQRRIFSTKTKRGECSEPARENRIKTGSITNGSAIPGSESASGSAAITRSEVEAILQHLSGC